MIFCLISVIAFCSCQKKAFKHVTIKGKIVYDSTMAPFTDTVYIMADDATSAKNSTEASIFIGEAACSSDGSFEIRAKSSRRSSYYLYVRTKNRSYNANPNGHRSFSAADNKTTDLGTILLKN